MRLRFELAMCLWRALDACDLAMRAAVEEAWLGWFRCMERFGNQVIWTCKLDGEYFKKFVSQGGKFVVAMSSQC